MKIVLAAATGLLPFFITTFSARSGGAQDSAMINCQSDQNETVPETADCLSRMKGLVTRSGETLRLHLANGKSKVYNNNENACENGEYECAVFRILRYYPQLQSFLVSASSGECGHLDLVSRRTGSVVQLAEAPQFSPNGKYFISIDDTDGCDRRYDFAIWSMTTDPPSLEFRHQEKNYSYWKLAGWNDDEHIRLVMSRTQDQKRIERPGEAVRSTGGWKIIMGKSTVRKD